LLIKSKVTELKPVAELLPLSGSLGLAQNNDVLPKKGKKGHSSEWRTANIWANQDKRLSGMDKDLSLPTSSGPILRSSNVYFYHIDPLIAALITKVISVFSRKKCLSIFV
jgi:hypothetical protein